jgi:CheY-like chemotaxis protein
MEIIFFTTDLLFSSRVAGAAARAGLSLRTAADQAAGFALLKTAQADSIVLLDLNSLGVDPAEVVPVLRALTNPPRAIIAYGPHVHEDRLTAAAAAGCNEVLTRGQFNATMDDVLQRWRTASEM